MIIIYLTDKHVKFEARNRIPALQPPAPRSQSARRPLEPEKRKTGTRLRPPTLRNLVKDKIKVFMPC